jgi:hypothetical protein
MDFPHFIDLLVVCVLALLALLAVRALRKPQSSPERNSIQRK